MQSKSYEFPKRQLNQLADRQSLPNRTWLRAKSVMLLEHAHGKDARRLHRETGQGPKSYGNVGGQAA